MKLCVPAQRKPTMPDSVSAAHQAVAEQRDLVGERHLGERQVVGMDVDVPQPGQQVRAAEIDDRRARPPPAAFRRSGSPRCARSR